MDEDLIRNFWISPEQPENLPDGWTWAKDMECIVTLLGTYQLLYPNKVYPDLPHYICAPIKMKKSIFYWYDFCIIEDFVFIWRPSICDPEVKEEIFYNGIFDEWEDENEDEEEEDI